MDDTTLWPGMQARKAADPSSSAARTDRKIREEFLKMLKRAPIEQIRVGELCRRCEINRSTFYRHYEDLPSLLDAITADAHKALFFDIIQDVDTSVDFADIGHIYIMKVCKITQENRDLYRLLLFGKTPTNLRDRMSQYMFDIYYQSHASQYRRTAGPGSVLHHRFLVGGIINMWVSWVAEDCKTPKEVLADVVREEILSFYETMGRLYGE